MDDRMFDYVQLFMCVWMIYCGIVNRGMMFKDDSIHKTKKEKFRKYMRFFCLSGGVLGCAGAAFNLMGFKTVGMILFIAFLAYIIFAGVIFALMSENNVAKRMKKKSE